MSDLSLFLNVSVLLYLAHCLLRTNVLQLKYYSSYNIIKYFNLSYFSFCKWMNESPTWIFFHLPLHSAICNEKKMQAKFYQKKGLIAQRECTHSSKRVYSCQYNSDMALVIISFRIMKKKIFIYMLQTSSPQSRISAKKKNPKINFLIKI